MDICLGLALTSAVLLRLPSPVTLSWEHSVEHFRLHEEWHASAAGLVLHEAGIEGLGAGVDLPSDAQWAEGRWRFRPALAAQAQLHLANSAFAAGYRVCWRDGCAKLADLVGGIDRPVTLRSCP